MLNIRLIGFQANQGTRLEPARLLALVEAIALAESILWGLLRQGRPDLPTVYPKWRPCFLDEDECPRVVSINIKRRSQLESTVYTLENEATEGEGAIATRVI